VDAQAFFFGTSLIGAAAETASPSGSPIVAGGAGCPKTRSSVNKVAKNRIMFYTIPTRWIEPAPWMAEKEREMRLRQSAQSLGQDRIFLFGLVVTH
jgi:hypothetical protein